MQPLTLPVTVSVQIGLVRSSGSGIGPGRVLCLRLRGRPCIGRQVPPTLLLRAARDRIGQPRIHRLAGAEPGLGIHQLAHVLDAEPAAPRISGRNAGVNLGEQRGGVGQVIGVTDGHRPCVVDHEEPTFGNLDPVRCHRWQGRGAGSQAIDLRDHLRTGVAYSLRDGLPGEDITARRIDVQPYRASAYRAYLRHQALRGDATKIFGRQVIADQGVVQVNGRLASGRLNPALQRRSAMRMAMLTVLTVLTVVTVGCQQLEQLGHVVFR